MKIILGILFAACAFADPNCDLYLNKDLKRPLMVFVHGGAWIGGDKSEYKDLGQNLQKQFSVAIVNYRLASESPHPADTDDVKASLDLLLKDKRFENSKIFLMGHSAGAYIIAYLATQLAEPRITGFIGLSGIYDLPSLAEKWPTYPDWFLKKEFGSEITGDSPKSWKSNSPSQMKIISAAPWLLIHSSSDELVDDQQSKIFEKHIKDEGRQVKIVIEKSLSHFEIIKALSQKSSPSLSELRSFTGIKMTEL